MNNPPVVYKKGSKVFNDFSKAFENVNRVIMKHSSAAAVTVSNTVDTEVNGYLADCKNYSENSGLKF